MSSDSEDELSSSELQSTDEGLDEGLHAPSSPPPGIPPSTSNATKKLTAEEEEALYNNTALGADTTVMHLEVSFGGANSGGFQPRAASMAGESACLYATLAQAQPRCHRPNLIRAAPSA